MLSHNQQWADCTVSHLKVSWARLKNHAPAGCNSHRLQTINQNLSWKLVRVQIEQLCSDLTRFWQATMHDSQKGCLNRIGTGWMWRMHTDASVYAIIEGSLEVKLPTIWTDEKQSREEAERRERSGERRVEEKEQEEEDGDARKGRKVAIHCGFQMICGSGGSKSRLATAAGAEPAGQRRDEKLHAVVARSTFPSQNVKNTRGAGHFWRLRCRKSARRCGAKHISKSKC